MSHEQQTILHITVAVAIALAGGLFAHRLKQSPIVGYLLAGMVIGPFTPRFSGDHDQIAMLAEIGVIFLMFALGIEFSLKELARVKGAAIIGTTLQVLCVMAAGTGLGQVLGWPLMQSVFFGGIISVSSTMVILKTLMDRGEIEAKHGRLLLSMLIVQDLAVVVLILLLPRLARGSENVWFDLLYVLLKSGLFIGVTLFLGARVVPRLMNHVAEIRSPELFILTAVALALGTASTSTLLGLSPALGAFMGGLMLTETDFDHRVISELVPMRDIFATLFFVSVGMLINPAFIVYNWPAVLGLALFIMLAKVLITMFSLLPFRIGGKTTMFTALGMLSIGEFNYVLAHAGRQAGVIPNNLYNLILTSSLITILVTPVAFWIAPRADRFLARFGWDRWTSPRVPEIPAAPELRDHGIVVGFGRVGRRLTRGLRQAGLPVIVIEQDLFLVREIMDSGQPAIYGDASREMVLAQAHPAAARVIAVALPDFGATRAVVHRARQANPDAVIVARAQRAENDVKLREAGATSVVVPEITGALALLEETLWLLGLRRSEIFTGLGALNLPAEDDALPPPESKSSPTPAPTR